MKIHAKSVLLPSARSVLESSIFRGIALQKARGESFNDLRKASIKPLATLTALAITGTKTFATIIFFYAVLNFTFYFAIPKIGVPAKRQLSTSGFELSSDAIAEAIIPPVSTNKILPRLTPPTNLGVHP